MIAFLDRISPVDCLTSLESCSPMVEQFFYFFNKRDSLPVNPFGLKSRLHFYCIAFFLSFIAELLFLTLSFFNLSLSKRFEGAATLSITTFGIMTTSI